MKIIKVLAIEGGGIRGIIPAIILSELQRRLGRNLHEVFRNIDGRHHCAGNRHARQERPSPTIPPALRVLGSNLATIAVAECQWAG